MFLTFCIFFSIWKPYVSLCLFFAILHRALWLVGQPLLDTLCTWGSASHLSAWMGFLGDGHSCVAGRVEGTRGSIVSLNNMGRWHPILANLYPQSGGLCYMHRIIHTVVHLGKGIARCGMAWGEPSAQSRARNRISEGFCEVQQLLFSTLLQCLHTGWTTSQQILLPPISLKNTKPWLWTRKQTT